MRVFSPRVARVASIVVSAVVAVVVTVGVSGYLTFARAGVDPAPRADAVVILGGEHDGRELYGIELAKAMAAPVVVLSNPYPVDDPVMRDACTRRAGVEVVCLAPSPTTTRGEALMVRAMAEERHWTKIVVVTWRYHMVRTREVFRECYSSVPDAYAVQAVPGHDDLSTAIWIYTSFYQYLAMAKAAVLGACEQDTSR